MKIHLQFFYEKIFSFLWDKCPEMQLLVCMVIILSLLRNHPSVSRVAVAFCNSTASV